MKPLKLTMQAFGSYGTKTVIDFTTPSQNLFLITGDTGSGKSTIFDAIVFAIYGETGSETNKKGGAELQSQYADASLEPYVELEFSENNEYEQIYTVKRIPKHIRKKQRGTGTVEVTEKVSLTLPDTSDHPGKIAEINRKLEEIVGLTKSQFMQVAMIAQGEFMQLLRSTSNDKKLIFRKLFHTEEFQKIVDELDRRKKEKSAEVDKLHVKFAAEVARICTFQTSFYPEMEDLKELVQKITRSKKLNIAELEQLMSYLQELCGILETETEKAQAAAEEKTAYRDQKRDAYTKGLALQKSFASLMEAGQQLLECEKDAESIQEIRRQIQRIHAAYEIKTEYEKYQEAKKQTADLKKGIADNQKVLPMLEEAEQKAAEAERQTKELYEKALQEYSAVSTKVNNAILLFHAIDEAMKKHAEEAEKAAEAEEQLRALKEDRKKLETQISDMKEEEAGLRSVEQEKVLWQTQSEKLCDLDETAVDIELAEKQLADQKKAADEAADAYAKVKEQHAAAQLHYNRIHEAFLDAQAGLLAKEYLKDGEPCPVCGSVEHPAPCVLKKGQEELTREMVEEAAKTYEELGIQMQHASKKSGSEYSIFSQKVVILGEKHEKLQKQLEQTGLEVPVSIKECRILLKERKAELKKQGKDLERKENRLRKLQKWLADSDQKLLDQKQKEEDAAVRMQDAGQRAAAARASLDELNGQKEFESEEQADSLLAQSRKRRDDKNQTYQKCQIASQGAKEKKDQAQYQISHNAELLPDQIRKEEALAEAYRKILAAKSLTEIQWMQTTELFKRTEADELQKDVEAYQNKKAQAQGAYETAEKAIGEEKEPDLETLLMEKEDAQKQAEAAQTVYEELKQYLTENRQVLKRLLPGMQERSTLVGEYTRLESLYNRLAGKVSGARMDIETFVQRYYLERILYAANRRFEEMTGGQYELRMVQAELAGEGKNRGLDLMVYSNVTGKEREIRTLSGGESFMAALSLALGMADQIQASSASVHLGMMFIDEGFGSLDDHSRNQAVRVLQQMAGGSRMIGIISHVSELKQMIDDQLKVTKNESGSSCSWQS